MGDYRSNDNPCALCPANDNNPKWTDCREVGCAWLPTCWNNATFAAAFPNRHRFFRYVPGVGIHTYCPDILHVKWIGCDSYFLGSVLMLMVRYNSMPDSEIENCKVIWGENRGKVQRPEDIQ